MTYRSSNRTIRVTYTIWGNGGRYEWIIREGETIYARSGMVFSNYTTAKRSVLRALRSHS